MRKYMISTILARAPLAFMSDSTETILVKTSNGPVRINKSDFDKEVHTEYKVPARDVKAGANPHGEQTGATVQPTGNGNNIDPAILERISKIKFGVTENPAGVFRVWDATEGGRFVVGIPGINEAGYASSKEAYDAVFAVSRQQTNPASVAEPNAANPNGEGVNNEGDTVQPATGDPIPAGDSTKPAAKPKK